MTTKRRDQIRLGPQIEAGRIAVRRDDEGERTVILTRPSDGVPIPPGAEVVNVSGECHDGWHDVTVLYRSGPAQVATPAYREGHDRIFGGKAKVGSA